MAKVFLALVLILTGCASYQYSEHGFLVEDEAIYHNAADSVSYVLALDSVVATPRLDAGGDTRRDRELLKQVKVDPKDSRILLSVDDYDGEGNTLLVWASDRAKRNSGYLAQQVNGKRYGYKRIAKKGTDAIHVSYDTKQGRQIGLIFRKDVTSEEGVFVSGVQRFLEKNVHDGSFFPDRTFTSCPVDDKVGVDITIPDEHMLDDYGLLKLYATHTAENTLEVYALMRPRNFPMVAFALCPGSYLVKYTDLDGTVLWQDEITTD